MRPYWEGRGCSGLERTTNNKTELESVDDSSLNPGYEPQSARTSRGPGERLSRPSAGFGDLPGAGCQRAALFSLRYYSEACNRT